MSFILMLHLSFISSVFTAMAVRQGVQITVLLLFSSHLVMLTSASRLSGTTASLATFNPGLIPSTPEFENKARVLISMVR